MAQKSFRIHFDIPESKLSTIVSLLSAEVSNLVIRDTSTITNNQSPAVPAKRHRPKNYAPREKSAVGSIHEALSGMKIGETLKYQKIIDILERNGYKASSHTSIISNFVAQGFMKRTEHSTLQITKPLGR